MLPRMNTAVRLLLPRFLLSIVVRLRTSVGGMALMFRNWLAALCKSVLSLAQHRDQPGIHRLRYNASSIPMTGGMTGERLQALGSAESEEQMARGTLATLPVLGTLWQDDLPSFQTLTLSRSQFKIFPAAPDGASQRYIPRMVKRTTNSLDIPPGQQRLLSELPQPPHGWRRWVHPEGNVSFYHERLRIFTESDVGTRTKEEQVLSCAATLIQQAIQMDGVGLDDHTELVLNVDNSQCWHYYFVDHTHRLVFWVVGVSARDLGLEADLRCISEYDHIRYFLERQYWYASSVFQRTTPNMQWRLHCEYYPHNRTLPKGAFADLRGMLNYFKTDVMTGESSLSPFAQDELVALLDLINSLKDDQKISDPYSIWVVGMSAPRSILICFNAIKARLMGLFTENQVFNFHGQSCARLDADTPLFEKQTWDDHLAFKFINVFLFGSPKDQSIRLQRIWVDSTIIQPRWKDFTGRLTTELGRYTVFSTVMLAVNFSFLLVPGVTDPGSVSGVINTIIYASVVSTTASIIFSFALLNVYSNPGVIVDPNIAARAMQKLSESNTGMAYLAITHSLPIACLIWSIMLFSAALAVQMFSTGTRAIVATLSVECFILLLFASMSMHVLWRFSNKENVDDGETNSSSDVDAFAGKDSSRRDVELGALRVESDTR